MRQPGAGEAQQVSRRGIGRRDDAGKIGGIVADDGDRHEQAGEGKGACGHVQTPLARGRHGADSRRKRRDRASGRLERQS
jgi:hypothetical protein